MSARQPAPDHIQPREFKFTKDNMDIVYHHINKYPEGRQQSALLPVLMLAQRQHENWLPRVAVEHVAEILNVPYIRAWEVATFYTMYNLAPMGRHHIQICGTTPCWLCGSDEVFRAVKDELGLTHGHVTDDGEFGMTEVECLGSCATAPMMQISTSNWDHYFEDLDYENTRKLLQELKSGKMPKIGSQKGRVNTEPMEGPTTLLDQQSDYEKSKKAG